MNASFTLYALSLLLVLGCVAPADVGRADVPADIQPGEIAFRMAGPNDMAIIIPVTIDGQGPYDFVLDTGATLTCVAESLATELSLEDKRGVLGRGATIGGSGKMRLLQIDSLAVGETEVTDVMACAVDLSELDAMGLEIDGLLGLNVLKNFHVSLDFERNVLQLELPSSV